MKTRKFISNELLASIDVLNTLMGGVTEPNKSIKQLKDHLEIKVKVPGVREENLKVEILNNVLNIFYTLPLQSDGLPIELPRVVHNNPIPYYVDASRISASYKDGFLIVTLPFNEMAEGYHRQVSIL